ncbi:MAG: sensor signal transduction histidine kinase [Bacteriovoracaceae bacterium]|nr:sensor signal transduction histidine kinase [Bacteriovoracaceae bacterium]
MTFNQLDHLGFQISHDLKGPVRVLSLNLDMLLRALDQNDFARAREMAEMALSTSRKLTRLMEGLAGLSMAGKARPDEIVDMKELVTEALEKLSLQIAAHKVKIIVDLPDKAYVDAVHMIEVWQQLIDNAIRYSADVNSSEPKKIKISSMKSDNGEIFCIEDNGHGVSHDMLPQLFSSLITNTNDEVSPGLGLLYCRRVIERHGGKIWHERSEGRTKFLFSIPAKINF